MTIPGPMTPEQTLTLIAERARSTPDADCFTVKVMGRRNGPVASNLATLTRARVQHIANAEAWVARLVGGGEYALTVAHATSEHERIGAPIQVSIPGQAIMEIDTNIVNDPSWDGPPELRFPHPKVAVQVPMQGTPRPVLAGYGIPAQPAPAAATPPQVTNQTTGQDFLAMQRDLEARAARVQQAEFDAKIARERAEAEARHQRERLDMETKFNGQLGDMKRKFEDAAAAPSRITETVAALTAAIAPILSAFISSNTEAKKDAARLAAEAAAEQRRSQEQLFMLVTKMGERPGTSPELTAMLELSKQQATAQGEMMTRMVDAMSTVSKTSVSMIETIAELSAPPEGSPMLDAVKEGVKAMVSLTKGTESGARKIIQTQQALPARTQQSAAQQQQRPPAPARPPQPVQARPAQRPVQQAMPVQPVEVTQFEKPAPPPNMPPAAEVVEARPTQQGFGDADIPPAVEAVNVVDYLEQIIREKYEPIEYVAKVFVEGLQRPEMIAALEEVEGDPEKLIANRLGAWLLEAENYAYIERLVETLEAMDVFEPEPEDGPGDIEATP